MDEEQQMAEFIADMQAARIAQGLMLEALIATHPHPLHLRDTWDRLVAEQQVSSLQTRQKVGRQELVTSALQHHLDRWTGQVLRFAPRAT